MKYIVQNEPHCVNVSPAKRVVLASLVYMCGVPVIGVYCQNNVYRLRIDDGGLGRSDKISVSPFWKLSFPYYYTPTD